MRDALVLGRGRCHARRTLVVSTCVIACGLTRNLHRVSDLHVYPCMEYTYALHGVLVMRVHGYV